MINLVICDLLASPTTQLLRISTALSDAWCMGGAWCCSAIKSWCNHQAVAANCTSIAMPTLAADMFAHPSNWFGGSCYVPLLLCFAVTKERSSSISLPILANMHVCCS